MLVAARRPVHKDQSLSYDIKDIVEQASAQWQQPPPPLPLFGSLCKEVHVFILVVMGMNTHTDTHTRAQSCLLLHRSLTWDMLARLPTRTKQLSAPELENMDGGRLCFCSLGDEEVAL